MCNEGICIWANILDFFYSHKEEVENSLIASAFF